MYTFEVGIYIKESVVDDASFISAETQTFIASILEPAQPNQILTTPSVKFLMSGAGVSLVQHDRIVDSATGVALRGAEHVGNVIVSPKL